MRILHSQLASNAFGDLSRRALLQRFGTGIGALGLAGILRGQGLLAEEPTAPSGSRNPLAPKPPMFRPRAKRIIHLFMNGGPSQVDTFDPKPSLTKYDGQRPPGADLKTERKTGGLMKSPFRFDRHGESGLEISEIFPQLSTCADDLCVIRSMHTNIPNHEPSLLMMTSGETQPTRPSMGSWLLYGLGTENENLPGFVVLCPGKPVVGPALWGNRFLPGIYQGAQINNSKMDPQNVIRDINNAAITRTAQREQLDLLKQLNELHLEDRGGSDNPLEARIQSLEMAFRMQASVPELTDIETEAAETLEMYGPNVRDPGSFAHSALLARRLVERGVRVVQLLHRGWDQHGDLPRQIGNQCKQTDQPIAALIKDLKQRGMLDSTLVVWGGEFGRTVYSQGGLSRDNYGRDHHPRNFCMWMAGGGIKGGITYGTTDDFSYNIVENPVNVNDVNATIMHCMGIDHERFTYKFQGLDQRLTGVEKQRVVTELLA